MGECNCLKDDKGKFKTFCLGCPRWDDAEHRLARMEYEVAKLFNMNKQIVNRLREIPA